jgi:hypothetical protein
VTDEPLPIPHRCGAVMDSCWLHNNYKILFCDICHRVVGFEKDGIRFLITFQEPQYKKKQYSEETLSDSV